MRIEPGQQLLHYRLIDKLGEGGMGVVWKAVDTRLDRVVAVKILPAAMAGDADALRRFEREARSVAALSHPNVLALYDVGEIDGAAFLVTEMLEGETLRDRLSGGPLSLATALDIAVQVARGLAAAHARGLVHRDLKPENVFVSRDGHVKLLDFGLAKAGPSTQWKDRTQTLHTRPGTVLGTVAYMAPEQLRGEEADCRADVFALGAVLHEMLCGAKTFLRPTPAETISAVLTFDPPPPGPLPALDALVERCLLKSADGRYASAVELVEPLQVLRRESGGSPGTAGLETSGVAAATQTPSSSIAVLPFVDLSPNKDQDYFCEGMAEEIQSALTEIENLRVAARQSTFRFKSSTDDVRKIGEALGVGSVLEGSVRTAGNRLRVVAKLVDVETGYQVWSERFDRNLEDVFAIQDEIAGAVARALRLTLISSPVRAAAGKHSEDLEAYNHYLRGRYERYTTFDLAAALRSYEGALARDPRYALARAGLAEVLTLQAIYGMRPPRVACPWAEVELGYAEALAGESTATLPVRCLIRGAYRWDWHGAVEAGRRALELGPENVLAHSWLSMIHTALGQHDEALDLLTRAREIDPLAPYTHAMMAFASHLGGRFAEAETHARRALELDPDYVLGLWNLSQALIGLDRPAEAVEASRRIKMQGGFLQADLATTLAFAGFEDEARAEIESMRERQRWAPVAEVYFAGPLIGLGEFDAAIDAVEKSVEAHDPIVIWPNLLTHRRLDDRPRYREVLAKMGLKVT